MKLTEKMLESLNEIRRIESVERVSELDLPDGELGNKLIDLYYESENSRTHELIAELLKNAGFVWLRKLVTRDTNPAAAPDGTFASLTNYLGMIAVQESTGNEGVANWR